MCCVSRSTASPRNTSAPKNRGWQVHSSLILIVSRNVMCCGIRHLSADTAPITQRDRSGVHNRATVHELVEQLNNLENAADEACLAAHSDAAAVSRPTEAGQSGGYQPHPWTSNSAQSGRSWRPLGCPEQAGGAWCLQQPQLQQHGRTLRSGTGVRPQLRVHMCGGCKVAHYCSKTCQTQHWKQHKPMCAALAARAAAEESS